MGIFGKSKKEQAADLLQEGLEELNGNRREEYAIKKFDDSIKLDSSSRPAFFHRGMALYYIKKYEEAIESFQKANEIKQDSETWDYMAHAYGWLHNDKEVLNCYNKIIEMDPDDIIMFGTICNYFTSLGQLDQVKTYINKYLSRHPDNAEAWDTKGKIFELCSDDENACDCYLKAISIDPEKYGIREGKIKCMRSVKKDVNTSLPLGQSEIIIGKYLCAEKDAMLDASSFTSIESFQSYLDFYKLGIVTKQPEIGSFICILTTDNLYLIGGFCSEGSIRIILPLEDITGLGTEADRGISIQYDFNKSIQLIVRPNDFKQFYTSIIEEMAKKREKIKGQYCGKSNIDFSSIKEYLKNGGVVMQTFKCPGCGAALEFPDNVDTTTCQFCGAKIKAVDLFEKIKSIL